MSKNKRTYEAMFLLDAGNSDFQAASEPIRTALDRSGAETLSMKPWDERRLAYEIQGHRRSLYVLTYFHADPTCIREIEHDCRLDERILRVLILQRDHVSRDELDTDTPADVAARRAAEAAVRRESAQNEKDRQSQVSDQLPESTVAPPADTTDNPNVDTTTETHDESENAESVPDQPPEPESTEDNDEPIKPNPQDDAD